MKKNLLLLFSMVLFYSFRPMHPKKNSTFPFDNLDFLKNCVSVDGRPIEPTERFVVMYSIETCKPCKAYEKEIAKKIERGVIKTESYVTVSTFYTDMNRYKERYFKDSLNFQLVFLKNFGQYDCNCSFPTFAGYENGKLMWQSENNLFMMKKIINFLN
jgi:hypothetical protein